MSPKLSFLWPGSPGSSFTWGKTKLRSDGTYGPHEGKWEGNLKSHLYTSSSSRFELCFHLWNFIVAFSLILPWNIWAYVQGFSQHWMIQVFPKVLVTKGEQTLQNALALSFYWKLTFPQLELLIREKTVVKGQTSLHKGTMEPLLMKLAHRRAPRVLAWSYDSYSCSLYKLVFLTS